MKNKKSQGLSLTTIVIAVIVLIVLIVLVIMFVRRMGIFGTGIEDCSSKGEGAHGPYESAEVCRADEVSIPIGKDKYCCVPNVV